MNYFPFHIGDYTTHTAHLEPMEDLAYRRLIDQYYLREGELPADIAECARLARMKGHQQEIEDVLREFFFLTDKGWRHGRCDEELIRMKDKQTKAKASAQASVNARSANAKRTLNGCSATNTNTNTNKPPKPPRGEPVGFPEFYAAYPRHEARAKAAQAFEKVTAPLQTLLNAIAAHKKTEQWTKNGGEFIPLPASWLNGRRWEDELSPGVPHGTKDPDSRASIEAEGIAKGFGPWVESKEQFGIYKARVRGPAPKQDHAIAALVGSAINRSGVPA